MAIIKWSEEFLTGIESIDIQHRRLVDLINKFEEAGRRGRDSRTMSEILNQLLGYTQEHFAHEEKLMAENGYPGIEGHRARHRQLLQKIEKFQYDYENEGHGVTAEGRKYLRHWVRAHILEDDLAYAPFCRKSLAGV